MTEDPVVALSLSVTGYSRIVSHWLISGHRLQVASAPAYFSEAVGYCLIIVSISCSSGRLLVTKADDLIGEKRK